MTRIQIQAMPGRFVVICCGVLALLSGCGNSEQPAAPQPEAAAPAKSASTATPASNPLVNMVKAVPAVSGEQAVELRFEIAKMPVLGEQFEVNLHVLALADVNGLELKVDASPNLSVLAGKDGSLGALKTGESARHTLQVRVSAPGISVLDLRLVAMINSQAVTANFAIPVALTDAPATAPAAAGK